MPHTIAILLAAVSLVTPGDPPPLNPDSPLAEFKPSFVPPEERNAAIAHGLAWAMYRDDLQEQLRSVPLRRGQLPEDWTPGEGLTAALQESQWLIEPVLSAASMPHCDFHLAREKGASLLLPHIGRLHQDVKLLVADARRSQDDEEYGEAAERIAGILGVAHHLASDGVTISSIAAARYAGLAAREAARIAPMLDDGGKTALIEQLDRFDGEDPFGHRAAVTHTVEHTLANSALDIVRAKREDINGLTSVEIPEEPTRPSSEAQQRFVREQIQQCRRWGEDVLEAWQQDDGDARLRSIHRAARDGEYGELAKAGALSLVRAWQAEHAALSDMQQVRQSLNIESESD